jgi:hypothetical protein
VVQPRPEIGGSGQELHRLVSPVGECGGEIEAQPARGEPEPGWRREVGRRLLGAHQDTMLAGCPSSPEQRRG